MRAVLDLLLSFSLILFSFPFPFPLFFFPFSAVFLFPLSLARLSAKFWGGFASKLAIFLRGVLQGQMLENDQKRQVTAVDSGG